MATKDIEKEEKEKKEKEQKEEKKESWWSKVPLQWMLIGVGFILIRFWSITSRGGELQELWWSVALVLFVWYIIGSRAKKIMSGVLTRREARDIAQREIQDSINRGEIEKGAKVYWDHTDALQIVDGAPKHYEISFMVKQDRRIEYKKATVFAEGDIKGYATIQDSMGKLTGREAVPIRNLINRWIKEGKKQELDLRDILWGAKK